MTLENIHLFKHQVDEEEEIIEKLLNPDDHLLRFTPPELLQDPPVNCNANDIWQLGCLLVETFSKHKVWDGYTETEIVKQLKNSTSPKVPTDMPQILWSLICECLNPFYKVRSDIKEVLHRWHSIMGKLSYSDLQQKLASKSVTV